MEKDNKDKKKQNTSFFCCSSGPKRPKNKNGKENPMNLSKDHHTNQEKVSSISKISSDDNVVLNNLANSKIDNNLDHSLAREKNKNKEREIIEGNTRRSSNHKSPRKDSNIEGDTSWAKSTSSPKMNKDTQKNSKTREASEIINQQRENKLNNINSNNVSASFDKNNNSSVRKNLTERFEEVANSNLKNLNNSHSQRFSIPKEERPKIIKEKEINMNNKLLANYNSQPNNNLGVNKINESKISPKEPGVEFTFKKKENRSVNVNANEFKSPQNFDISNNEGINSTYRNKTGNNFTSGIGITTIEKKMTERYNERQQQIQEKENILTNKINNISINQLSYSENNNESSVYNQKVNQSDQIITNALNTEENVADEEFKDAEVNIVDDESDTKSVISSNIRSHIQTPKMISGFKSNADNSFALSSYTRSENSRMDTQNNILMTEHQQSPFILKPGNVNEDTEFEITNEHFDGFGGKFIETPKSSNLYFNQSLGRGVSGMMQQNINYNTFNRSLKVGVNYLN
jgi:hypothetical protein